MNAFTWAGFLASLAAGGLLGSVVQQVVQWRRDKAQRAIEDDRRQEDRRHALEDARTIRRLDRYVAILSAASTLDRQIWSAYRTVELWAAVHGARQFYGEERMPLGMVDQRPEVTAEAEAEGQRLWASRESLERAIYESWPLASSSARTAAERIIRYPFVWQGYMGAGTVDRVGQGVSGREEPRDAGPDVQESINTTPAWRYMEDLTAAMKKYAQAVRAYADLIREELQLD